ncbi:hypothetical protein M3C58_07130 [Brachybacterium muris]|uniref:hypothetical protein n=1 Tax=Brachybacterium muris TaxID=219301 RepID=UPI00223C3DCD|nr:hypothetical protein [Brachybacterium muris]MCT1997971.1 hypothetical protein [Brachybacterium muris]MCT2260688.1 hypothetical protein [Brachybacterium muris]
MVLFNAWVDDARTSYRVLEQAYSTGGTTDRTASYPYESLPEYQAYRYNTILD